MTINVGKMRERITIRKKTITYMSGVKVENCIDYYSCGAELLDLYGQEKYSAYQSKLENSIKFRVRYCNLLVELIANTKEYQVIWNGIVYNLLFVDTLGFNKKEIILQVNRVN